MTTRAQLKQHAIQVSWGRQQRQTSLFRAARLRLHQWAGVIRAIIILQGPSASPASVNLFATGGAKGLDNVYRAALNAEGFDRATEVDDWLEPLKKSNPAGYSATVIRYVQRDLVGFPLSGVEQVQRFKKYTGLGRASYYGKLDQVLQLVCAEILQQENKDL